MKKITAQEFFKAWLETVSDRREHLQSIWRNNKEFTCCIKDVDNSVIGEVARKLGLLNYQEYYHIDSVLYKPEDKTPRLNETTSWFRDIRVAFEHENNSKAGLFQEASHLVTTNCDLRVLVTYPNGDEEHILEYLHEIIKGNRMSETIANENGFLIIFGYETGFEWDGFIYKTENFNPIKSAVSAQ